MAIAEFCPRQADRDEHAGWGVGEKIGCRRKPRVPDYANLNDLQSGPAVAGWVKRVQDMPAAGVEDETPGGIVLHSLGRER